LKSGSVIFAEVLLIIFNLTSVSCMSHICDSSDRLST